MLFAAVGVFLAASVAMAHDATKPKTKSVSGTISLASTVKIGDKTLPAGEYKVTIDGETLVFAGETNRDREAQTVTVPFKAKNLDKPSDQTRVSTSTDPSGTQVMKSVQLKGSSVEYDLD
jgi:hypothetical protein